MTPYNKLFGTWQELGKIDVLVNLIVQELKFGKIAMLLCLFLT